jgi:hypothetical protein
VVSKPVAAEWAESSLDKQWIPLIERALLGRHHSQGKPDLEDVKGTQEFIRFALEYSQQFNGS